MRGICYAGALYTVQTSTASDFEGLPGGDVALSTAAAAPPAPADNEDMPALPDSNMANLVNATRDAAADPSCPSGSRGGLCMLMAEFEFNDARIIRPVYSALSELGVFLKANPEVAVELQGHTDSRGPDYVNLELSRARARAVKRYLVREQGIEPGRLSTKGFGSTKPAAPNETAAGRALNRRVIAVLKSPKAPPAVPDTP